jgi:CRISPR system Cascade subunit CasD
MAGGAANGELNMTNTLFLVLEGPMQSWGERARWSVRDSAPEPTKSGVVGLLACALGLNSDEDLRDLSSKIQIGVLSERPGAILVDYHTVYGGVMSAEGKVKINATTKLPETVETWRSYLHDAAFLIAIRSDRETVADLADKLQTPVWPVFLGRKSCPPSRPIFDGTGEYEDLESALADWLKKRSTPCEKRFRAVIECQPGEGVRRRDEIDSLSCRTFKPRFTRDVWISSDSNKEAA